MKLVPICLWAGGAVSQCAVGEEASCPITHLVRSLVELLGIKRGADAEGDAGAEEDVVGDGRDAAIVDLGLFPSTSATLPPNHDVHRGDPDASE